MLARLTLFQSQLEFPKTLEFTAVGSWFSYPSIAFSSEGDTGSREENASKQKMRARFCFNQNRQGSRISGLHSAAGQLCCTSALDCATWLEGYVVCLPIAGGSGCILPIRQRAEYVPRQFSRAKIHTLGFHPQSGSAPHTLLPNDSCLFSPSRRKTYWPNFTTSPICSFEVPPKSGATFISS
jgi:hypothetical protein